MPGRKTWGWRGRPSRNYTTALRTALDQQRAEEADRRLALRDAEQDERLRFLESSISPLAGSHDLERAWGGDRRTRHIGLVPLLGGLNHHVPDSRTAETGDNGWPDNASVIRKTLYVVEFKRQPDYPSPDQRAWLRALEGVENVVTGVVKPKDWPEFVQFALRQYRADGGTPE